MQQRAKLRRDPRLNAVASLKLPAELVENPVGARDPRLNAVASLKPVSMPYSSFGISRDPRLNAVASLKPLDLGPGAVDEADVIHGLMPWPH